MPQNRSSQRVAFKKLTESIDNTLDLLQEFRSPESQQNVLLQNPSSLLQQCLALCKQYDSLHPEPVRIVHHFACTGGTLICKCIAAMPNIQLLSEIDPLSTLVIQNKPYFAPTDMMTQLRQSTRGTSSDLMVDIFLNDIGLVYRNTKLNGQRLILRDHAHSHYCVGDKVLNRPSLHDMVASRFSVLSVITARHPLDSYLSLCSAGWLHFSPQTIDEYSIRYLQFLRDHKTIPVLKYEDFVENPQKTMAAICTILDISFSEDFAYLFDVFNLTGDSGRSGTVIESKPRRPVGDSLTKEAANSKNYLRLLDTLEYSQ